MWNIKTRRTAAVVLGVGCAVASAQAGAFAAPHHHAGQGGHHKPKPKHHKVRKGFYVADQNSATRVTSSLASAAVVDVSGNLHVVTTARSAGAGGNLGHIVYYSRPKGSTKWKPQPLSGLRPLAGGVKVQAGVSSSGNRVWAVFYECNGVFAVSASATAKRLPEPTMVQSADNCATATPSSNEPPIADAVGGFGSLISVLLPDPAQENNPAIWSGHPGGTFTPGPALPTTDSFVPEQITTDNGEFIAVGQGSDGVNEGVYYTKLLGDTWSDPKLIASLNSPSADYQIESVVAVHNSTYVGLASHSGLFFVHGSSDGQWGGVIRMPHTTKTDTSLRLVVNSDTGHLHAAFTRHGSKKKAGILQQARTSGWSTPTYYSHSASDVAQQITFTPAGKAVIGYLHK